MPGIKTHCIQAALTGAAIAPFTNSVNTTAVCLSVVLVDVDHVVEYVRQTGSLRIWGVFPCCHIIHCNLTRGFYVLNLFHTLEFMLLIAALGLLQPVFFYALAGALWHWALDLFVLNKRKLPFARALSIVEYLFRARNPNNIVRFQDLLRIDSLAIPQDSWNYSAWIEHWKHCRPLC